MIVNWKRAQLFAVFKPWERQPFILSADFVLSLKPRKLYISKIKIGLWVYASLLIRMSLKNE